MSYNLETMKTLFNMEQKMKELESTINKLTIITTEQEIKYNKQSKQIEIQNVKLYKQNEQLNEQIIEINEQLFLNKVNELEIKIDKLENTVNEQNIKINKLETIVNDQDTEKIVNHLEIHTIKNLLNNAIEKTIYYDNAIEKIGHIKAESVYNDFPDSTNIFSNKLNSKAINFDSFVSYYTYINVAPEPFGDIFNSMFGYNSLFGLNQNYVDPILLLSLNIFYNLKTLVYTSPFQQYYHGRLYINAFTNNNIIERSYTPFNQNAINLYHRFGYKITPLYTVETLFYFL
jgi:hypothetical protein